MNDFSDYNDYLDGSDLENLRNRELDEDAAAGEYEPDPEAESDPVIVEVLDSAGNSLDILRLPENLAHISVAGGHDGYYEVELGYSAEGIVSLRILRASFPILSWQLP